MQLRCVAHDGTKVRAHAGSDKFRREKTLRAHIAEAQEQIEELEREAESEEASKRIKAKIQLRQFSLCGLVKVNIEALWICLTYNIQQWLRLCWRSKQLVHCTA